LIRIYLGQSFERAFSNSTTYWGVLVCFVAMYYTNQPFNSSMIFSTVEIMVYLKSNLFLASMGISYIYELKVLFKRFADIYSTENISMRRIDESTKRPVEDRYVQNQPTNKVQEV
jgi:hypothetical protein